MDGDSSPRLISVVISISPILTSPFSRNPHSHPHCHQDHGHLQWLPHPSGIQASSRNRRLSVIGANIGLGKEASKQFVRLNAGKIILAVLSIKKCEAAKAEIEAQTKRSDVVEVYELDYSSYASVKVFAARVAELERANIDVLNAGVATEQFEISEENEITITVNVISTARLALLLLPILRSPA